MENSHNSKQIKHGPSLFWHAAFSLLLTFALLWLMEAWRQYSVLPFINPNWLLWAAGLMIVVAMIITGFKPDRDLISGRSKNT